ncbi:MAG: molybdenum cofactor biosynthesis protein [Actinomycetota bacterium]
MRIEVRVFGGLADRVGGPRLTVELDPSATVADLRARLVEEHPQLAAALPRTSVAVNLEVARDAQPIGPDDEVALLPPVAGGAGDPDGQARPDAPTVITGLSTPPFDLDDLVARVSRPSTGGTVTFVGTVRDHAPDLTAPVVTLEYSAYPEMADKVLGEVAAELCDRHPALDGVALLHAVGELAVGDQTIAIVCASAHREEAFAACRDALEQVKQRVPVFKREHTADGAARWVGLSDHDHPDEQDEQTGTTA